MKKIYYIILFILGAVVASCSPQQDNFFEESSSQRVNKSMEEVQNILSSAKNGWLFQYFPGTKQEYGGFNMVVSFTADGKTTVYNNLVNNGAAVTSSYNVKQFGGALLSFDTYNAALHYFSDPVNPDGIGAGLGKGLEGDFEFVVVSYSADKVVLRGVKTNGISILTPLQDGKSPADCLKEFAAVQKATSSLSYDMYVNGKKVTSFSSSGKYFKGTFNVNSEAKTIDFSCIITSEGMKLYEPVTFDDLGKDVYLTNFKYDAALGKLVSTDKGVDVYLQKNILNLSVSVYTSPLLLNPNDMSTDFQAAYIKAIKGCLSVGEKLNYIKFSYSSMNKSILFNMDSGGFKSVFMMPMTPVVGTEDQLTVAYKGADDNGKWYLQNTDLIPLFSIISGQTFIVSVDDTANYIIFVNAKNANSWFKVRTA